MGLNKFLLVFSLYTLVNYNLSAKDTAFSKPQKLYIITASTAVVAGHTSLYFLWYANYPKSNFHFINDNKEWKQMDKFGHAFSAYNISNAAYQTCKKIGFNKKKSLIYGGLLGLIFQTPIEVFDGISAAWGASAGDIIANTAGWGLFYGQQIFFDKQIACFKWSFKNSGYATLRPNTLGGNFSERILKDYNGQTYWLSFNLKDISGLKKMPAWINIALGYGAKGMIGGNSNLIYDNNGILKNDYSNIPRYRTYSASLDIDLSRIKTNRRLLTGIFRYFNWIKIPFPSVGYNRINGLHGNWIGF